MYLQVQDFSKIRCCFGTTLGVLLVSQPYDVLWFLYMTGILLLNFILSLPADYQNYINLFVTIYQYRLHNLIIIENIVGLIII